MIPWKNKLIYEAPSKAKKIKEEYKLKYQYFRYDINKFFSKHINDPNINYTLNDFVKKYRDVQKTLDILKGLQDFFIELEEKSRSGEISREILLYFTLKFYASNFEVIFSILKPICDKINSAKKIRLDKKDKPKKIYTSGGCLIFLKQYDKRFFNYLDKIFYRELRNAISHESYYFNNERIIYNGDHNKKKWISDKNVFKLLPNIGLAINGVQRAFAGYTVKYCQTILKDNLNKKQSKDLMKTISV